MSKSIPHALDDLKYSAYDSQPLHLNMLKLPQFYASGYCPECGELYILQNRHITRNGKDVTYHVHGRVALRHILTEDLPNCNYELSYELGGNLFYPLPKTTRPPSHVNQMLIQMASVSKMILGLINEAGGHPDELWGIVPNGGGDTYFWELVEAFMVLGYLPPAGITPLPVIRGRGEDEFDQWLIEGCKLAADAAIDRATRYRFRLNDFDSLPE